MKATLKSSIGGILFITCFTSCITAQAQTVALAPRSSCIDKPLNGVYLAAYAAAQLSFSRTILQPAQLATELVSLIRVKNELIAKDEQVPCWVIQKNNLK